MVRGGRAYRYGLSLGVRVHADQEEVRREKRAKINLCGIRDMRQDVRLLGRQDFEHRRAVGKRI